MKNLALFGILAVAGVATSANAFVVRAQWVSRVGTVDTVVPTVGGVQTLLVAPGSTTRFRLQFGVFDDAGGVAPAGGYIGWNLGTLSATVGGTNSRTPGRVSPFNFAPNPPGNGLPSADPFTALTSIDNTLGLQAPAWGCTNIPNQVPLPQPAPTIRGLNAFIDTYEITTVAGTTSYSFAVGGNTVVASGWGTIGPATPPDCGDPNVLGDETPGSVTYAPMALPPITGLTAPLNVVVPAPGAAALLGLAGLIAGRRRRA